jgi:hypothetical protein
MITIAKPAAPPVCGSDGAPGPQPFFAPPDGGGCRLRERRTVLPLVARDKCCNPDWCDPICVDCPDR